MRPCTSFCNGGHHRLTAGDGRGALVVEEHNVLSSIKLLHIKAADLRKCCEHGRLSVSLHINVDLQRFDENTNQSLSIAISSIQIQNMSLKQMAVISNACAAGTPVMTE